MSLIINKIRKIVLKNEFLSLTGNLSYAVLGFVSFLLLTRSFEKEIFGQWVLFVTASSFIEMFRFGLTRTALVRFLSGANTEDKKTLIGSNWVISVSITVLLALIVFLVNVFFYQTVSVSGFRLFFAWYPVLAFVALPFNNALTVLQAQQEFGKILFLRIINILFFDIFLAFNLFYFHYDIAVVIVVFMSFNAFTSFISLIKLWDGIRYLKYVKKETIKKILNFGKFTLGTLIGSNVLKSADAFIIGLSPILGAHGVALYSVPLKLTEVMEIPLRSMAATAFPKMSKESLKGNINKVRELFYTYTGALTLLFIPFAIFNFIFADFFVQIIGSAQYLETANIYRAFCLYGLILPLDRFTGVALDAVNLPKYNMYKVALMVTANIIGDLIAVFYFKSIFAVAVITILMTLVGIFMGNYFFNKKVPFKYKELFYYGFNFYWKYFQKKRIK